MVALSCTIILGLSPRVRGNPSAAYKRFLVRGSIPASAGEPGSCSRIKGQSRVYPRECGGTWDVDWQTAVDPGLSPRVRGNPANGTARYATMRSIPASAGEPYYAVGNDSSGTVYPRECGGTLLVLSLLVLSVGLSPRVRGNLS